MRSNDIKADGKMVYAYAPSWEWRLGKAKPVVVSATRLGRPYRSTADGVRIHYLKDDLTLDGGRSGLVRAADIRELWETYKPRADEEARLRAEKKASDDAEHAAIIARLDEVFDKMDVDRPQFTQGVSMWGHRVWKDSIDLSQLADLLESAYRGGFRDGSR